MSTDPLTAQVGMSVEDALKILINNKITGMPVIDSKGKMVGVISEYDILAQIASADSLDQSHFQKPIEFSKITDSVSDVTTLNEIISRFLETKFRRLPVVDRSGKLVGIITRRDLMRIFYYRAKLRLK